MRTNQSPSRVKVDTLIDENDGNLSAGDVSLREALSMVKTGGTIIFDRSLQREDAGFGTGVIGLSLGALTVQKSLRIRGLGRDQLTVSGNGESSVFVIDDGDDNNISEVIVDGLSITAGTTARGGIFSRETLSITDSRITGNSAGIVAETTYSTDRSARKDALVITNSIVSGNAGRGISLNYQPADYEANANKAKGRGNITVIDSTVDNNGRGGISRIGGGYFVPLGDGAPAYSANAAGISVENSSISGNGGVGVSSYDGTNGNSVEIQNSSIINNGSTGIAVGSDAGENEATITNSIVSGNQGAGVDVAGIVTVSGNNSDGPKGLLSVSDSVIENNRRSGLIASEVSVTGSTLTDNGTNGIVANDVRVLGSTITGNSFKGISATYNITVSSSTLAQNAGGAIAIQAQYDNGTGTSIIIDSSTITDNGSRMAIAGGIFSAPDDTARNPVGSTVNIAHTTISNNTGSRAGGIFLKASTNSSANSSNEYSLRNTIVAGNSGATDDLSGELTRSGFNLIGDGKGATGLTRTDIVGTTSQPIDPQLGNLQDNGGPTFTQTLLSGSPAIDAGSPNTNGNAFDQRGSGFARVVDGNGDGRRRIDIGAVEIAKTATVPTVNVIDGDQRRNQLLGTNRRDRISGFNNADTLTGRNGRDTLLGGAGNDILLGDGGNDTLLGGAGKDKLTGGSGKDTFVYENLREGKDLILDFKIGQDVIDLSAIFDEPPYNRARYNSDTPFEDYIRLGTAGRNTRLRVLNPNASRNGRDVFTELAVIQRVNPADLDESSFVL